MKEKIVSITAYKDGGTKRIILNTGIEYYVNNRLHSTTKGEVFPAYPSPTLGLLPVSDREKTILIQCLEEYGRESGDYGIGTTIHDISMTIQNKGVSGSMGYTIIDIHTDIVVVGYTVMADNGDEQYLTVDEFDTFKKNRKEL